MPSFFNCTNATRHVDPASTTESPGLVHVPPRKMNRVEVEHMLTEYVRDGAPEENRLKAKERMLECFDSIHSPSVSARIDSISQALDSDPPTNNYLGLNFLELKKLPEDLGFLKGVHDLDLTGNLLEELPDSFGSLSTLKKLKICNNKLHSLPESMAQLSALETLNLGLNLFQHVPESICQLSKLVTLDLTRNQLESLPPSIASLKSLENLELSYNELRDLPLAFGLLKNLRCLTIQHNQLQTLPSTFGSLTELRRVDLYTNFLKTLPDSIGQLNNLCYLIIQNNQLESLPESIGNLSELQELRVDNIRGRNTEFYFHKRFGQEHPDYPINKLQTLPASIGNLQKLRLLNVKKNQLSDLPRSLVQLPVGCNVHLESNPLPQPILNRLAQAFVAHQASHRSQGPDIFPCLEYNMSAFNVRVAARPLNDEIASWRSEGGVDSSAEAQQPAFLAALGELSNIEATALSGQLARLRVTAHYKKAPQDLVQRINAFLNYVEQAPDLLQYCAAVAVEGTATCDDRIALAFIQLEESVVNHRSLNETNLNTLVDTAGGLHKSQLLQTIAQQKVSTLVGFVDPTEIILKYVVKLSKEFNLPSQLDDMIFHRCALQVAEEDIQSARRQIQEQSTDANLNIFLANWHPWQQALNKQYPSEYAQVQAEVKKHQEKMHEKMDNLIDRLAATKSMRGERSTQYLDLLAESNVLKADYRSIETDSLVKLTDQVRQQIGPS
ncbi:leucine-rich repeat domain-containing protein [Limnobacter parvus]|uniref:NEL domain-containing protein n=1 Tax=Limnobacter parvus TaxID=2939690 RepID=A0ABT1XDT6_9BURK|nr:NEL-type E3 ubiquitin ligase domain-containing protein [Limnobacter parvus]MCR2745066.1 hypothetical protein [Limnobacter parvus]